MMKKILLSFFCAVIIISVAHAQEVSEKKELAVFSLSYTDWSVPTGALAMVDAEITAVFTELGRFDVKGLDLRLEAGQVSEFINKIQEVNESNIVVEEKYRLGEETFTEADFRNLTRSFLIVIPSLTFYDSVVADTKDGTEWEVELQTSFSIIKVKDSSTVAQFSIETYGSGETQQEATRSAAEAISAQLEYKLRSIEEFQLHSGIIEVIGGGMVILELGSNMGLNIGDEFSIVNSRLLSTGHTVKDKTGLLVITDVKKELSYGLVIYNDQQLYPGDQLSEIPRFGFDVSAYVRGFIEETGITGGTIGTRAVLARGVWDFRPFAGAEIPLVSGTLNSLWPGLPLTVYGGGELMWYIGRLQIEPSAAIGGTGLIPIQDDESFWLTHVGGTAALTLNWMLMDNFKLFVEGGYSYWFSVAPAILSSVSNYGGIFGGVGVTFKM